VSPQKKANVSRPPPAALTRVYDNKPRHIAFMVIGAGLFAGGSGRRIQVFGKCLMEPRNDDMEYIEGITFSSKDLTALTTERLLHGFENAILRVEVARALEIPVRERLNSIIPAADMRCRVWRQSDVLGEDTVQLNVMTGDETVPKLDSLFPSAEDFEGGHQHYNLIGRLHYWSRAGAGPLKV
jgi:hypothetical protein